MKKVSQGDSFFAPQKVLKHQQTLLLLRKRLIATGLLTFLDAKMDLNTLCNKNIFIKTCFYPSCCLSHKLQQ
jgi:hypothetical protein